MSAGVEKRRSKSGNIFDISAFSVCLQLVLEKNSRIENYSAQNSSRVILFAIIYFAASTPT